MSLNEQDELLAAERDSQSGYSELSDIYDVGPFELPFDMPVEVPLSLGDTPQVVYFTRELKRICR